MGTLILMPLMHLMESSNLIRGAVSLRFKKSRPASLYIPPWEVRCHLKRRPKDI